MPLISKSLWATAAVFAAGFAPIPSQALMQAESTVAPGYNASCNCYRNVPYGSTTWIEPTTRKLAKQAMDVWMPPQGFSGPRPIAYYGHPNGTGNYIAYDKTAGSLYNRVVKPLTDQGFIVISYEFRHPVVNYVAGSPTPRFDIQKAINTFVNNHAVALNADPSNTFISGQSRGGGLGILTALTGKLTGTTVRAIWTYQAQTTFNCTEMANTFVIESDRTAFMTQCTAVPDAGSSLHTTARSTWCRCRPARSTCTTRTSATSSAAAMKRKAPASAKPRQASRATPPGRAWPTSSSRTSSERAGCCSLTG